MPVLYGVFLYMGITSLAGVQVINSIIAVIFFVYLFTEQFYGFHINFDGELVCRNIVLFGDMQCQIKHWIAFS